MKWILLTFACAVVAAPTSTAFACGGFFCSSSPINQSREVVVYGHEPDGTLTMAVQINYSGFDEDFAWILPVPAPPDEISIGTDALFQGLQARTEPQIVRNQRTSGSCSEARCSFPSYGCGLGCGAADSAGPPPPTPSRFADAGMGVTVHSEGIVGPYDTVVLGATTGAEVLTWLADNGYDIPMSSETLLEPYAAQGFVFIALRLNANRDSNTIRPIVMHMATDEACLPIRLTAVATNPDLPIALFFLGDAQAHSTNYSFVDPTDDLELWMGRRTWDAAVAAAVATMGGQAFSTDYAGSTPELAIELPEILDLASAPTPSRLLEGLMSRGYRGTPLLLELFEAYIPPPAGVAAQTYYNCLGNGAPASRCGGEPLRFDANGLIAAIDESVTGPRREAQALVERHAYTTRLATTMRAEDMTIDPVFELDADLPDVALVREADLWTRCSPEYYSSSAPQELELNGVLYRVRGGEVIDEDTACRRMGGVADAGGGGCSAAANSQGSTFVILTVLGFALMMILRKRS